MELYKILVPAVLLLVAMLAIRAQFDRTISKATQPSDASALFPVSTPITWQLCGPANEKCTNLSTQLAAGLFNP